MHAKPETLHLSTRAGATVERSTIRLHSDEPGDHGWMVNLSGAAVQPLLPPGPRGTSLVWPTAEAAHDAVARWCTEHGIVPPEPTR